MAQAGAGAGCRASGPQFDPHRAFLLSSLFLYSVAELRELVCLPQVATILLVFMNLATLTTLSCKWDHKVFHLLWQIYFS